MSATKIVVIAQQRHIDISGSVVPARAASFDADIESAMETGRISFRRAKALQAARNA